MHAPGTFAGYKALPPCPVWEALSCSGCCRCWSEWLSGSVLPATWCQLVSGERYAPQLCPDACGCPITKATQSAAVLPQSPVPHSLSAARFSPLSLSCAARGLHRGLLPSNLTMKPKPYILCTGTGAQKGDACSSGEPSTTHVHLDPLRWAPSQPVLGHLDLLDARLEQAAQQHAPELAAPFGPAGHLGLPLHRDLQELVNMDLLAGPEGPEV